MSSKTGSTRKARICDEICSNCESSFQVKWSDNSISLCGLKNWPRQYEPVPKLCPYHGLTHDQALIQIMTDKLENPHANDTTVTGYIARTR